MADFNKVFLIGNLTRSPEMRHLSNGTAVTTFGLAMNRTYTMQNGEKKEEVCFVRVVVFGKQAEACGQYLVKGKQVFIEGRLQYRTWEMDGQKKSALDVVADRVQFLGSRTTEGTVSTPREEQNSEEVPQEVGDASPSSGSGRQEDLPF